MKKKQCRNPRKNIDMSRKCSTCYSENRMQITIEVLQKLIKRHRKQEYFTNKKHKTYTDSG